MKIKMFYRLEKEVGVGIDFETLEPVGAYTCVSVSVKNVPTSEQYKELGESMKALVANQLDCDPKYIIPVTEEEYVENTDEEIEGE